MVLSEAIYVLYLVYQWGQEIISKVNYELSNERFMFQCLIWK